MLGRGVLSWCEYDHPPSQGEDHSVLRAYCELGKQI